MAGREPTVGSYAMLQRASEVMTLLKSSSETKHCCLQPAVTARAAASPMHTTFQRIVSPRWNYPPRPPHPTLSPTWGRGSGEGETGVRWLPPAANGRPPSRAVPVNERRIGDATVYIV